MSEGRARRRAGAGRRAGGARLPCVLPCRAYGFCRWTAGSMCTAAMRVGRRRVRSVLPRRDSCSMVSRKDTQLSLHRSLAVVPVGQGAGAAGSGYPWAPTPTTAFPPPGQGTGLGPVSPQDSPPSTKWGAVHPTFKAGLVDALELGAVFVAAQPQLLVHVRHDQARRSLWVSWCLRGRAALAAEELGVGVLPLVHLPCGRGGGARQEGLRAGSAEPGAARRGSPSCPGDATAPGARSPLTIRLPLSETSKAWEASRSRTSRATVSAGGRLRVSGCRRHPARPPVAPPHLSWAGWWPGAASRPRTPRAAAPCLGPGCAPASSRPGTGSRWQGRGRGRRCSGPPGSGRGTRGWCLRDTGLSADARGAWGAPPSDPRARLTDVVDSGSPTAGAGGEVLCGGDVPGLSVVPLDVGGD